MTPKQLRKLYKDSIQNQNSTILIGGFSKKMTKKLLYAFSKDTEFTRNLIREMRRAKTKKARKKILEKYKKEVEKERKKLNEEDDKISQKTFKTKRKRKRKNN